MGTVIISTLQRGNSGTSPFPVSIPADRLDAHIIVADLATRDALEEWRRSPRMTCFVIDQNTTYRLGTDITIAGQVWTNEGSSSQYQVLSEKGQANGYVPLNAEGYIDPIYVRSVYVSDSYIVNNEAERLALEAKTGDICNQLDTGEVFVKLNNNSAPTTNADWADITPASAVTSVNGMIGAVSITINGLLSWAANQTEFNTAVGNAPAVLQNASQIANNAADIAAIYAIIAGLEADITADIPVYSPTEQYEEGNNVVYDPGNGRLNLYRCKTSIPGVDVPPTDTFYWDRIGDFYTQQEIDDKLAEKADLVEGKVPLFQLPTNDLQKFYVVGDLSERNNLDVDVDTRAIVLNATGDARLPNGGLTEYLYKPSDPRADTEGWVWTSEDTDQAFDFNRPIRRIPEKGKTPGGNVITEGLENMFFGPTEPDIKANDLALAELGSTSSAQITGTVSKEEADTIDQIDYVRVSDETVLQSDIPSNPSASTQTLDYTCPAVDIVPGVTETYRVDVIHTTGGQQSKTEGRELPYEGVYPVLYDNTIDGVTNLYSLNKLLTKEENIYIGTTGGEFVYFAIPELYSDLVDIQDQHSDSQFGSQFNPTPTIVSVTSTGLTNDWTTNYKLYKSNYKVITDDERYKWLFQYEDEAQGEETSSLNQTKQGYFDPKMPRALDHRFYKATKNEILAIPKGARYKGMEIYTYNEDDWYQFRGGVENTDLVISNRDGGTEPATSTAERTDWDWSEGIPGGGNVYLDFVITQATFNDEIASFQSCILFIDKSLQQGNYSVESTNYVNDTIRIQAQSGDEAPDAQVILFYNRTNDDASGGAPTFVDKEFQALVTSTDGDPAGAVLSFDPDGYVEANIRGMQQIQGNADKTKDCYWSRNGGATALPLSGLQAGDALYWNGSKAGFELDTNDTITLNYNV